MKLHLTISPHVNQLECLSQQVGVPVVNNRLDYPPAIGKGYVQGYFFPAELSLYEYYAERIQPLGFQTVNPAGSGMYCLFITLSAESLEKTVGEETHWLSRYAPESVFYYAPGNRIHQQLGTTGPQQFVVITFTRSTFKHLLAEATLEKVLPRTGSFLFMDLDVEMEQRAASLIRPDEAALSPLNRYQQVLHLLALILQKIHARHTVAGTEGMLQPDIKQLFLVRQYLLEHLSQAVSVKELAGRAGFSETKLKRLFSRLFGTSVHHYQQTARIEKARELLCSRLYSVSEVGYRVGYTNMTHFAKAFFKHYGIKPGQYLQTVKGGKVSPARPTLLQKTG